ncbi:coiled-coil domain-containing protein 15 isoform X2 [Engraulis encrasicolus]|uniref:coiled-coil domain-containing protein 15 isoform X2 n=1 Tax=Engraulis encrasicolus TaxID=184585 RepID=UPI002FCF2F7E
MRNQTASQVEDRSKKMSSPVKKQVSSCKRHMKKDVKQKTHDVQKTFYLMDYRILAERNPSRMAVGAWVDSVHEWEKHPTVLAAHTQELHMDILRQKEINLLRFQDAVRQRLSQQAQIRQKQQMERSCKTAEQDGRVLKQASDAAQQLSPRRGPLPSHPPGELAICSPRARWVEAREVGSRGDPTATTNPHSQQRSKAVKLVRHRLATCKTTGEGDEMSELPGGVWKSSPTRDKHGGRMSGDELSGDEEGDGDHDEESVEDEGMSLIGRHDQPLCLQNLSSSKENKVKAVCFNETEVCERLVKDPISTDLQPGGNTNVRSSTVLWPFEDQEDLKKQRQSQFLMYRRLYMDIERQQVKEVQRHRKHLQRIERIKAEKERLRHEEEERLERVKRQEEESAALAEREYRILERLRLEEEERAEAVKRQEKAQKNKEASRYIEALRAQMRERISLERVELPALCCCGDGFWDSHPDTCANNCVFYKNPKAYAQALQSVLLSCDQRDQSASHRASTRRVASMYAQSPKK